MAQGLTFAELVRRVRAGDQAAATELVRTYEPQVRRAVRVRLTDPRLRQLIDSVDVCQSVLANFFVRAALGQFDLETPEQLLGLLVTMARNKVTDLARRHRADRRDGHRSVPLEDADSDARHPAAPGPSPSDVVAEQDLLQAVRRRLSEDECYLAEQRSRGRPWEEIAAELGATPQALRMRLARALDRVGRELAL